MENKEKVLEVKDLTISFKTDRGIVHAVRGVSFDLYKGETLCIVGESGSGKSVTNKAIMGISAKNAIIENGSILYEGEDLVKVSEEEFHRIRGHKIGMIFQDPLSALNPVMKIGKQITEATMINKDILKRRYNELISKELVAFRNNEANFSFNVTKVDNELERNKNLKEKFDTLNKEIEKLEAKVTDLGNKQTEGNEKLAIKLEDAKQALENKNSDRQKLINSCFDIAINLKREHQEKLESIENDIERNKKVEATTDLKKEIKELINKCLEDELNFNKEKVVSVLSSSDIDEFFKNLEDRSASLKALKDIYKANFKQLEKPLKADLKVAKKKAKVEVKEYHAELKVKFNEKEQELVQKLADKEAEIVSYKTSLSPEAQAEIDKTLAENKIIQKKIDKENKKYHDVNVSKVSNADKIELKPLPDAHFEELLKEKEAINKEIADNKEDFINKTKVTKKEAKKMALQVMKEVGIPLPERRFKQYPFEFSGGMRQRIVIAIALTANPDILICDEPTTALDVTIQSQILELINRLKETRNLSCIFITHDLGVVANMADRVAVMYAGKIVEYGKVNEVFFDPRHPYTWALLSSIPDVDSKEKLEAIPGTPPDMIYPPEGDAFALRNKYALAIDFKYQPPYFKVTDTHYAATWLLYPGAPHVDRPKIVEARIQNALAEERKKNPDFKLEA